MGEMAKKAKAALEQAQTRTSAGQAQATAQIGIGYALLEIAASVDQLRFELDSLTEIVSKARHGPLGG